MGQILQKNNHKQTITPHFGNCQETLLTTTIHSESKAEKAQKASGDVCVLYDITVTQDKDIIHYWFRLAKKEERGRDQYEQIAGARHI